MLKLKFELKDGRKIFLDSFWESGTYAGLLEGRVNDEVNRHEINSVGNIAKQLWPNGPFQILGLDFYMSQLHKELPAVTCTAQFISYKPARDMNSHASSLVVIWFQDEMFPLLTGANDAWLRDVEWNQLARDFEW